MYAGPVAKNFHAFVSYCSTREMFMNQLGISVSVARSFHAKGISIDTFQSLVRSVDRVDVLGLQSRTKNKHVPCLIAGSVAIE